MTDQIRRCSVPKCDRIAVSGEEGWIGGITDNPPGFMVCLCPSCATAPDTNERAVAAFGAVTGQRVTLFDRP